MMTTQQGLIILDTLSIISIEGPDSNTFLNNLLTNDVDKLNVGDWQMSALCNPKGRVIACFRIFRQPDNNEGASRYLMLVSHELAETLTSLFQRYKFRAKVSITVASEQSPLCLFNSNEAASANIDHYVLDDERIILFATLEQREQLKAQPELPATYWHRAEILNGIAQVYADTSEIWLPQFLNLDITQAISFNKGCYPGQEVVTRLRHLGNVKHRMVALSIENNALSTDIALQAPVFLVDSVSDGAKPVGAVSAMSKGDNNTFLSVVLQSSQLNQETAALKLLDTETPLQWQTLPYQLT